MTFLLRLPVRVFLLSVLVLLPGAVCPARAESLSPAPEAATGFQAKAAVEAKSFLVVAANPFAAKAGAAIIRQGGSAIDAAIAVQLVLGLVEPQSSGLGGGAFLLHYDHAGNKLIAFDAREIAPAAATPDLFLDASGQPLAFYDAVIGGRSVGVPGVPRLLEVVHQRFGKLPWAALFQPAIDLAEQGFPVSPRMATLVAGDREHLTRDPVARAYFFDADGQPLAAGTLLKNPAYAETLKALAAGGADAFYKGAIAQDIVAKVHGFAANPGRLAESDFGVYTVKEREPVCASYRVYKVCGAPPPSSGGTGVGEILGLLEHFDMPQIKPMSVRAVHLFAEASALAFADREAYIADPDFGPIPIAGLMDPTYLLVRAQLINPDHAIPTPILAGNPPWREGSRELAPGEAYEFPSTSQFTIVDRAGDIVSETSTVEDAFGSRLMVDGFMLNNQLTDFSFRPEVNGVPVANRVEAGKRPRSAMSPTVVFDQSGRPVLALGSPGGSQIIDYVALALVGVLDWHLDVQSAINLPHVVNRNGITQLEQGTSVVALKPALEALGHTIGLADETSGLHGIQFVGDHMIGGADPRREGLAVGE